MTVMNEISDMIQLGKAETVKELIAIALKQGFTAEKILNDALLWAMEIVSEKFKKNDIFIPEVIIAAKAMNAGTEMLKPYLAESGVEDKGVVVIGTVKGDLHDVGKNLVKIMMQGKGLKVIDLGVNVDAETFVQTAKENHADVIACSALLTSSICEMKNIVSKAKQEKLNAKIIIGGAPATKSYCDQIGADGYSTDATTAAELALSFC